MCIISRFIQMKIIKIFIMIVIFVTVALSFILPAEANAG